MTINKNGFACSRGFAIRALLKKKNKRMNNEKRNNARIANPRQRRWDNETENRN
jgi:hypothetical protein